MSSTKGLVEKRKFPPSGGVPSKRVGGVIGRITLIVMFLLECLDLPPAQAALPPRGGYQLLSFSPISLKSLAAKQTKYRCKSILVRAQSYSADPTL